MALSIEAAGATYAGSGTPLAVTITTTAAGKILVGITRNGGNPVTSISNSAGLTFASHAANAVNNGIEMWEADSSGAQSAVQLDVNFTTSPSFATLLVANVMGAGDFDANASVPDVVVSGDATISTDASDTIIVSVARGATGNPSAGSGFTRLYGSTGDGFTLLQYAIYSAAQSSLAVPTGEANNGHIATALAQAGGTNFDATGDLDAQSSTLAGAATVGRTSTGALAAQSASIAGAATVTRTATSGGYEIGRLGTLRTSEDIRRDRKRFGVIPEAARVIAQVAATQAERLSLDEQQRLEHLERELELRGIEYESRYLELLNVMRERLIAAEIGRRLRLLQQIEEEAVVMLMLAAAVA